MLHCELWPRGSLKSTMVNYGQTKVKHVLIKVEHDSLKLTMVYYDQTKVKYG